MMNTSVREVDDMIFIRYEERITFILQQYIYISSFSDVDWQSVCVCVLS